MLKDLAMAARHLHLQYSRIHQEVLGALFLDRNCHLIGQFEAFRGVEFRVLVATQPILVEAIRRRASGVLLFHTHPSGNPAPTRFDLRLTDHMREACELVNITLHDHLVIAGCRWISIRRLYPW